MQGIGPQGADDVFDVLQDVALGLAAALGSGAAEIDPHRLVGRGIGDGVAPIAAVHVVGARAANEGVVAAAPEKNVIARIADEQVRGGVAGEDVVELRASDVFDAGVGVADGVARVGGWRLQIGTHAACGPHVTRRVDAVAAFEGVGTATAFEGVVAGAALQAVVATLADQGVVVGATGEVLDVLQAIAFGVGSAALAGREVHVHGTDGTLVGGGVVARVAEQFVGAAAPFKHVVARPAFEPVDAGVAAQRIVVAGAAQVLEAGDHVAFGVAASAGTGLQVHGDPGARARVFGHVATGPADEPVRPCAPFEHVVARPAFERVGTRIAPQDVVVDRTAHAFDADKGVALGISAKGLAAGQIDPHRPIAARVAGGVVAGAADERIGPGAAFERVVARPAIDDVVTRLTVDKVVADHAEDAIVAGAGTDLVAQAERRQHDAGFAKRGGEFHVRGAGHVAEKHRLVEFALNDLAVHHAGDRHDESEFLGFERRAVGGHLPGKLQGEGIATLRGIDRQGHRPVLTQLGGAQQIEIGRQAAHGDFLNLDRLASADVELHLPRPARPHALPAIAIDDVVSTAAGDDFAGRLGACGQIRGRLRGTAGTDDVEPATGGFGDGLAGDVAEGQRDRRFVGGRRGRRRGLARAAAGRRRRRYRRHHHHDGARLCVGRGIRLGGEIGPKLHRCQPAGCRHLGIRRWWIVALGLRRTVGLRRLLGHFLDGSRKRVADIDLAGFGNQRRRVDDAVGKLDLRRARKHRAQGHALEHMLCPVGERQDQIGADDPQLGDAASPDTELDGRVAV